MSEVDPPRSRFFSLAPIGVGSAHVESLDGYVCRLAAKHRVRPSVLRGLLGDQPLRYGGRSTTPWPGLLEKIGWAGGVKATRLAELTLKPEVARLGLANLAGHASPIELLASRNAWCPTCLRDMLNAGQFYLPQVWRLHCYTHCTRHNQRLRTQCTHCRRSTSSLDTWFQAMGVCHWCNRSLLTESDEPEASSWTDEVVSGELEALCAALSGDFGDQRHARSEPLCSWLLREGRRRSSITSPESIAKVSGLGMKVLSHLEHSAEVNCSLQDLVRLCVTLGIGVPAAIRRDLAGFSQQPLRVPLQHASVKYKMEASVTSDQVRRYVVELLRKGDLPTVTQLQVRFRVPTAKLLDLLDPRLKSRMQHRLALFRRAQQQQRRERLIEKIVATRKALLAMCQSADAAAVAAALGRGCSKAKNFRAAFAQAMLACD